MTSTQATGYDFADRTPVVDEFDRNRLSGGSAYLRRARTERGLSGDLMKPEPQEKSHPTLTSKWDRWMVNGGGTYIFFAVWIFLQAIVAIFGFATYQLRDNFDDARTTFGLTYAISRTAALILHLDAALILIPVCRDFLSVLRHTPLNHFIPFDRSLSFHIATAWSIVFWAVIHILAHIANFAKLSQLAPDTQTGGKAFLTFLGANFSTGPGVTGWLMTICLATMVFFSMEKQRQVNFERFWYSHHLYIVFFVCWQLHGMFCMIKPDRPPYCSWNSIGIFWRYWLVGGLIYVYGRIMREVRSRHSTYISKVIQHPDSVMEIHIIKEKTQPRAGQYILLSCPEISYFQWHPFTLTSAPEEDYISVHMRVVGDFTRALATAVGCNFDPETDKRGNIISLTTTPRINGVMPRLMIDGPFGSASEDWLNYETVVLVGAGIGVTPFASILKSIWYRMNNFNGAKPIRLSKVYFTWVIRDFTTVEWFHSLLQALEQQDIYHQIEINIYSTGQIDVDNINNLMLHNVRSERDAITSLRAPTQFGRPNWDRLFRTVASRHPDTDIGVFLCGPRGLCKSVHEKCNQYTNSSTRFFFSKGVPFVVGRCDHIVYFINFQPAEIF